MTRDRKAKIVCTIGPATSSPEKLRALIEAGMNVARLNFSHGDYESHRSVIETVRQLSVEMDQPIAVLQDLAGPKVRVGYISGDSVLLEAGNTFTLTTRKVEGYNKIASVSYPQLPDEVEVGDKIMLADGTIVLSVEEIKGTDIHCRIIFGGNLSSRKGVNCPSGLFGLPILREKDLQDLRFGVEHRVDYVALSFVRTAADILTAKAELAKAGATDTPVIAKIETHASLGHFDEILKEADGVMIARGDLSIETPFTKVPLIQKQLISKTNLASKPVITATQMLWSMIRNPNPTRAEVADVANAVFDGSDAVMLSDETAVGEHPIRAVITMDSIACDSERGGLEIGWINPRATPLERMEPDEEMARSAVQLANRVGADFISTITRSGRTARLVAKYRPNQPVYAVTPNQTTYQRLSLVRGVFPQLVKTESDKYEEVLEKSKLLGRQLGLEGKKGVFVSKSLIRQGML